MADEYIKRKDVLECIKESRDGIDWGQSEDGDAFLHYSACLYRTIASNECFPPADVVEVRHGKWRTVDIFSEKGYGERYYQHKECSTELYKSPYNFCPHCGAKMDGEL